LAAAWRSLSAEDYGHENDLKIAKTKKDRAGAVHQP
jgi:hypothetical protein